LKQQELEENNGHRRKRKSCALTAKETQDRKTEENIENKVKEEDKNYKIKSERKMPPPMEFAELLKLAEKKQYEPVIIDIKPKIDEERPMTKRQRKEWEYLQEKERRERERMNSQILKKTNSTSSKSNKTQLNKIPKKPLNINSTQNKNSLKPIANISEKIIDKSNNKHSTEKVQNISKDDLLEERKRLEIERRHLEEMRRAIEEEKKRLAQTKNKQTNAKSQPSNAIITKSKLIDKQITKNIKLRSSPSEDLKSLSNNKSKQFSLPDIKPVKSKKIAKKPFMLDKKSELFIHYNHITKLFIIKI
jgi:protein SPT2